MRELRTGFSIRTGFFALLLMGALLCGCRSHKPTSPIYTGPFVMRVYFPLNPGDLWFYGVVRDSVCEFYVDGDVNLGEPFVDLNKNGEFDPGEDYDDSNGNGQHDSANDPWSPGVPFIDRNGDGEFDLPNGRWDEGEFFMDIDSNETWNCVKDVRTSRLKAEMGGATSISADGSLIFERCYRFLINAPPGWTFIDRYTNDGFSNDSLGLRWHSHSEGIPFNRQDDLKDYGPVIFAKALVQVGDSVIHEDTCESGHVRTWVSVFETVEKVSVSAGRLRGCLKFRCVASDWTGDLQLYNGTSYWWFAPNVGIVKIELPREGVRWQLDSATVCGITYP